MCLIIVTDILKPAKHHQLLQATFCPLDPTVDIFLGILSKIILIHSHPLYKTLREIIFPLLYESSSSPEISSTPTLKAPYTPKSP